MKQYLKNSLATLAFATVACGAFAQDGPPPPPDMNEFGAPPMGMQRPPMPPRGPMGPAGPMLLLSPQVQNELHLTDNQIQRIRAIARPDAQGHPGMAPDRRGPGMGPGPRDEVSRQRVDGQIKEILNGDQYRRWQQIQLQIQGPMALGRIDVAKKVGLSIDQLEAIQNILEENRPPMPGGPGGPRRGGPGGGAPGMGGPDGPGGPGGPGMGGPEGGFGPDQPGDGQAMPPPPQPGRDPRTPLDGPMRRGPDLTRIDANRMKIERKILNVLNEAQLAKWKQLIGTPFKLDRPNRPPREQD